MASTRQPGYPRSAARTAVVWDALRDVLGEMSDATASSGLSVLDIGGGTGGFAVRVAELGHQVTVVDPSPDALAILARRAEESGVAERVHAHQGDLAGLASLAPGGDNDGVGRFEVVLCHGLLEIVEDPRTALGTILDVLRPAGTLSLLVNQRHAAVLGRAMAGHFAQARLLLDDTGDRGGAGGARRFTAEEVRRILDDTGFEIRALHAVRAFSDLVPSSLVDAEPGAAAALVELERAVCDRPEYLALATQLHALAVRR
ncbi:MAG TPA: methyltransferase domain-containing protein [Nocardioidaceae bacterium]|nr:methyltransferase domain-containing protein [Nocardioidaceae bacterium]